MNCLALSLAVTMHLGLAGDYTSLHPHARCDVNNTIAGIYYNSEENISGYVGYQFQMPYDIELELGWVTGYNTEKERAYARWSGVSDYEVYYKNKLIGEVYKTTSYGGYWGYSNLDFSIKGHSFIKGEAVRELYEGWKDQQNEK